MCEYGDQRERDYVLRPNCPRCHSANSTRRSFLPPRWGGRFTCLDCGRVWWPGHCHLIGCKGPAIMFVWFVGLFIASAFCLGIFGIHPGFVAFLWLFGVIIATACLWKYI